MSSGHNNTERVHYAVCFSVNGVLNTLIVPVEVVQMIADVIKALKVNWRPLPLGHQLLLIPVDHASELFDARAIADQLLIVRDRRLCRFHGTS